MSDVHRFFPIYPSNFTKKPRNPSHQHQIFPLKNPKAIGGNAEAATDPRLDVTARLDTKEVGGGSGREAWSCCHMPRRLRYEI